MSSKWETKWETLPSLTRVMLAKYSCARGDSNPHGVTH